MNNRFMTSQKFYHKIFYFETEFKESQEFFATKVWSYTVAGFCHEH